MCVSGAAALGQADTFVSIMFALGKQSMVSAQFVVCFRGAVRHALLPLAGAVKIRILSFHLSFLRVERATSATPQRQRFPEIC